MLSWRGPFHPGRGGAEIYTERVLRGLVARGHRVTWFSARHRGEMPTEYEGIQLDYGRPGLRVYPSGYRWLRRYNLTPWDVIIDQVNTFGFCAPLLRPNVACLIHQVADDVWDSEVPWPGSSIGKVAERALLRVYRSTPFMTMCQDTIDELQSRGWNGAGYITPTGIDRTYSFAKSAQPSLCFLGRFDAKAKRLDHAVAIHQAVRSTIPECELWVIGRGQPPPAMQAIPGLRLFANAPDEERDVLLGRAWCCLATSVREGWGRVVTEAGAAGTPTVAYDVPGLRSAIVDGESGLLVRPSINEAADLLVKVLRHPGELARLGASARERAAAVPWSKSVDAFESALEDIKGSRETERSR